MLWKPHLGRFCEWGEGDSDANRRWWTLFWVGHEAQARASRNEWLWVLWWWVVGHPTTCPPPTTHPPARPPLSPRLIPLPQLCLSERFSRLFTTAVLFTGLKSERKYCRASGSNVCLSVCCLNGFRRLSAPSNPLFGSYRTFKHRFRAKYFVFWISNLILIQIYTENLIVGLPNFV